MRCRPHSANWRSRWQRTAMRSTSTKRCSRGSTACTARRASLGLTAEQQRLLEQLHSDFVRAGATLKGADRERFAQINERLAALMTAFGQNVLADESAYRLTLATEADMAGLPAFVRDAARQAAADRGLPGAVITLSRSLIVPFLTFSRRRDLREAAWRAWTTRGEHDGPTDNRGVIREILALRAEQSALLGYPSFADYALANTMARTQGAVMRLLDDVWSRALPALERERAELMAQMKEQGATHTIEPWDWRYWAEQVRQRQLRDRRRRGQAVLPARADGRGGVRLRRALVRRALRRVRRTRALPPGRQCLRGARDAAARWSACSCTTTSRARPSAAARG